MAPKPSSSSASLYSFDSVRFVQDPALPPSAMQEQSSAPTLAVGTVNASREKKHPRKMKKSKRIFFRYLLCACCLVGSLWSILQFQRSDVRDYTASSISFSSTESLGAFGNATSTDDSIPAADMIVNLSLATSSRILPVNGSQQNFNEKSHVQVRSPSPAPNGSQPSSYIDIAKKDSSHNSVSPPSAAPKGSPQASSNIRNKNSNMNNGSNSTNKNKNKNSKKNSAPKGTLTEKSNIKNNKNNVKNNNKNNNNNNKKTVPKGISMNEVADSSISSQRRRPKRLFLAIFGTRDKKTDRRLRHLIRSTYLNFYDKYMSTIKVGIKSSSVPFLSQEYYPRVCSFQEFMKNMTADEIQYNKTINEKNDCHIVYTFVVNGPMGTNPDGNIKNGVKKYYYRPNEYTIHPTIIDDDDVADIVYLKPEYQLEKYSKSSVGGTLPPEDKTQPSLSKVLSLYDYILYEMSSLKTKPASTTQEQEQQDDPSMIINEIFEYIAFTDVKVMIQPTKVFPMNGNDDFWFHSNNNNNNNNSGNNKKYFLGAYSDSPTKTSNGTTTTTTSSSSSSTLIRSTTVTVPFTSETKVDRFVMLSTNLLQRLEESVISTTKKFYDTSSPGSWFAAQIRGLFLKKNDNNDNTTSSSSSSTDPVVWTKNYVADMNIVVAKDASFTPNVFLSYWDDYQDRITSYQSFPIKKFWNKDMKQISTSTATTSTASLSSSSPPLRPTPINIGNNNNNENGNTKKFNGPRILMGIFTMDSPDEARRRWMIRNSYLSYYRHAYDEMDNRDKICSLQAFQSNATIRPNCQFVYTFVIGGRGKRQQQQGTKNKKKKNINDEKSSFSYDDISTTDLAKLYNFYEMEGQDRTSMTTTTTTTTCSPPFPYDGYTDFHYNNKATINVDVMGNSTLPPPPSMTVSPFPLLHYEKVNDEDAGNNNWNMKREMEPNDSVFLNIHENMEEGKSPSWLLYASRITVSRSTGAATNDHSNNGGTNNIVNEKIEDDMPYLFDYIAKVDSDTLIFPDIFLNSFIDPLPSFPHNTRYYGGLTDVVSSKNVLLNGPNYFQGSLYILSWDMAEYITSTRCHRTIWQSGIEDRDVGNWVHSYPWPIRLLHIGFMGLEEENNDTNDAKKKKKKDAAIHPIKRVYTYRHTWNDYVKKINHMENILGK